MKIIQQNKVTITIVIILIAGLFFVNSPSKEKENVSGMSETVFETQSETGMYVHISGAVNSPGVYEVKKGQRLFEVIELAGGFVENAYTDNLNLASEVSDGQKIYIYTLEQWQQFESGDSGQAPVNINTATKEKLMTLPGIGESRAEAIVNYRETKGNFQKPEDIMKVDGIKQSAYEKIKELICV